MVPFRAPETLEDDEPVSGPRTRAGNHAFCGGVPCPEAAKNRRRNMQVSNTITGGLSGARPKSGSALREIAHPGGFPDQMAEERGRGM
jgi:hypothetical protein